MGNLKNQADYSKYKCPYAHIEKECGHELHGPEGYEDTYSVWCACGFRGSAFCLDPNDLKFEKIVSSTSHGRCCVARPTTLIVVSSLAPRV